MKKRSAHWLRSALCLMLAVLLAAGTCVTAFAATESEETKTINYVSLGDSMTNGYGLNGYNGNSGVADYGYGSYTNQFAEWLVKNDYADEVNHFQLALSAMRAEDLHWLLEVDYDDPAVVALIQEMDANYENKWSVINQAIADGKYTQEYVDKLDSSKKAYFEAYEDKWNALFANGDSWTWRELVHDYRFNVIACYVKYYEENPEADTNVKLAYEQTNGNPIYTDVEALQIVAKYFQDAVANADIVSNGIGNGNFGVFILGRIQEAIGFSGNATEAMIYKVERAIAECPAEVQAKILALKDVMYASLENYVSIEGNEMMEALINSMVYGGLSYVLNWCGATDAIVKLNPDAEVVTVGLMNTMNGIKMEIGGVTIDVGQWMGTMLDSLNAFMAAYPVTMQALGHYEDATFYYAEERQVECYADTYNSTIYTEGVVRDRFVKSIVGEDGKELIWSSIRPIAQSMGTELQTVNLAQIQAYEAMTDLEKIGYAQDDSKTAMSIALYLAAENAILQVLRDGGTMSADAAVKMGSGGLSTDGVVALFEEKLAEYTPANTQRVISAIGAEAFASLSESKQGMLVALFAMPDALGEALAEDKDIGGLLNLYAHCLLGNGLSGHPSQGGHDQLAAAVEEAYGTGHTSKDQTLENVEALLAELCKLVEAYGPEVAQQVWQQWVEYGYVDMVETSIEELYEMLAERYEYYTTEALPAIEASVAELTAEKDELVAQLAELNAQLEVAREQLAAAVEAAAAESTEAAEALKAELETAVAELTGAIASIETMLSEIELELDALAELAENIAATVAEMEQTLVDVSEAVAELKNVFEDVVTILSEAANSSAAVLDTVIASFQAARDTAVAAAEVVSVTMTVATELADDIDTMIEKVVTDGTALYEKFVNEVPGCFDVLVGYYEMLPAELREMIEAALAAAVEAGKDALESETQEKLEELEKTYGPEIEAKKAELEALIAEIEAAIAAKKAEMEAAYDAALAELEAQKAELEAQLAAKKAELEQLAADAAQEVIDEINAKIAEIEAAVDAVEAAIAEKQAELEAAIAQITAEVNEQYASAVAALESAIAELQNAYDAAAAELQNALAVAIAELEAAVAEQLEDLSAEAFEQIEGYLAELSDQLENTKAVLAAIAAGSIESVEEMVAALEALGAAALEDINAAVEELIDTVNAMLYQATHADIEVEDELKYVALGDGSAEEEGYVEILAAMIEEQLGDDVNVTCFNNAAVGNTVADELDDLQALAAKVYDADLVTLGYSDVTFLVDAFNVLYYQGGNVDWSDYVEDEYIPYIEQLVDEIQAELVESMGDEATAAMVTTLANAMAFSAVQYAVELPMLAAAIHEINPEAVIVIVGMYNPLADVTLDLGGSTIDVGEYVDYLVDAVAVHGLAYSLISGSSIYVDARDVATNLSSTTLSKDELAALLYTQFAAMYPSAAGDQYIAEKIADALNISYTRSGLLGDADSDGKITTYDATLILQYKSGRIDASQLNLAVCDVDGDGKITTYDATLILQYKSGRIEKFPAEA